MILYLISAGSINSFETEEEKKKRLEERKRSLEEQKQILEWRESKINRLLGRKKGLKDKLDKICGIVFW